MTRRTILTTLAGLPVIGATFGKWVEPKRPTLADLKSLAPLGDAYAFRDGENYIVFYDPTLIKRETIIELAEGPIVDYDIIFIPAYRTPDGGSLIQGSVCSESKEAIKEWARGL